MEKNNEGEMRASIILQSPKVPALIAGVALAVMAIPVLVTGLGARGLPGAQIAGQAVVEPSDLGGVPRGDIAPGIGVPLGREPGLAERAATPPAAGDVSVGASVRAASGVVEGGRAETGARPASGVVDMSPSAARLGTGGRGLRAAGGVRRPHSAGASGAAGAPRKERDPGHGSAPEAAFGSDFVETDDAPPQQGGADEGGQALSYFDYNSYDDTGAGLDEPEAGASVGELSAKIQACETRPCRRGARHHRP